MSRNSPSIVCDNLDLTISDYTSQLGYQLDMLMPADSPRVAVLSKNGETIKVLLNPRSNLSGNKTPKDGTQNEWIQGRAGMMYRDLIPSRLSGKLIASHIRITESGEVPDYVHYHKVGFQMIYCLRGRIRVVYEDQGPPFWLEPGDCVLQPPEIRHRVLEAEANSEVLEISSPSEHETWLDHELDLPTAKLWPDREFGAQRFVRHVAKKAKWKSAAPDEFEECDTGIAFATNHLTDVRVVRHPRCQDGLKFVPSGHLLLFVISGEVGLDRNSARLKAGDAFVYRPGLGALHLDSQGGKMLTIRLDSLLIEN